MQQLLKDLSQNPIVTLSSLFVGVFSLLLAILFYLRGRRMKTVRYEVVTRTIVEDLMAELDGLEVRYAQIPQSRVSVSRVLLWNEGTETINGMDLIHVTPLHIHFESGARLLDARIISSDPANQIVISPPALPTKEDEDVIIPLSFDYLDRNDGIVVQLVHTGNHKHHTGVHGKIKGVDKVTRVQSPAYRMFPKILRPLAASKIFGWFLTISTLFYAALPIAFFVNGTFRWYVLFLTPVCLLGTWIIYIGYAKEQVPLTLRHFADY